MAQYGTDYPLYNGPRGTWEGPALRLRAVTPNDGTDLPDGIARGFHVSVAGDVAIMGADDTAAVTLTVSAGATYPYAIRRVLATGTTATVVVLY